MGYVLSPAPRADFINELLRHNTSLGFSVLSPNGAREETVRRALTVAACLSKKSFPPFQALPMISFQLGKLQTEPLSLAATPGAGARSLPRGLAKAGGCHPEEPEATKDLARDGRAEGRNPPQSLP